VAGRACGARSRNSPCVALTWMRCAASHSATRRSYRMSLQLHAPSHHTACKACSNQISWPLSPLCDRTCRLVPPIARPVPGPTRVRPPPAATARRGACPAPAAQETEGDGDSHCVTRYRCYPQPTTHAPSAAPPWRRALWTLLAHGPSAAPPAHRAMRMRPESRRHGSPAGHPAPGAATSPPP